jgi:hypothetical protein
MQSVQEHCCEGPLFLKAPTLICGDQKGCRSAPAPSGGVVRRTCSVAAFTAPIFLKAAPSVR